MIRNKGLGVNDGIAIGAIHIIREEAITVSDSKIDDIPQELEKFGSVRKKTGEELDYLIDKAKREVGEKDAQIIGMQRLLLDDLDFVEAVEDAIKNEHDNVSHAILTSAKGFAVMFEQMDDSYMRERATDIIDLAKRMVGVASNDNLSDVQLHEECIILADDLTPSETIHLDKSKLLGFVLAKGSTTCHTAILAKNLGIPAVVGSNIDIDNVGGSSLEGKTVIIDAAKGEFIIEPDENTLKHYRELKEAYDKKKLELKSYIGKPTVTKGGRKIKLYANISDASDIELVQENDAEGIGLFRTEFLFLDRETPPSEEEQYEIYKKVIESLDNKYVILRTMDIGSDKSASYINLDGEENPAMGLRGIRLALQNKELFLTQLKAILRASRFGNVGVMLPMIDDINEINATKELIKQAQDELKSQGIEFGDFDLGIMIETPASAMIADILAKEVKFFSIGTNDLVQYTLAVDRMNGSLGGTYNPYHEGVIRLIERTIKMGKEQGIWVGICGELASDEKLIPRFVDMGVDELSVAPSAVLKVRKIVANCQ